MNAVNSLDFYEKTTDPLTNLIDFIQAQYHRNTGKVIDQSGLFKILEVSEEEVKSVEYLKDLLKQKGLYEIVFS